MEMAKFCGKCGKPLIAGQICECQRPVAPAKAEPWRNPDFQNKTAASTPRPKPHIEFNAQKAESLWNKFKNKVGIGEPETNTSNAYERNMKIVPECVSADEGEIPVRQYTVAKLRTLHKLHWAEGRLQVTNKRVIFRAPGKSIMGRTVLQHEFAIDEIAGVEVRKEPAFGFFEFIIAYLVGAIGMFLGSLIINSIAYDNSSLAMFIAVMVVLSGIASPFVMHKRFFLKSLTTGLGSGAGAALSILAEGNKFVVFLAALSIILWWICCIINSFRTNLVFTIKTKGATGAVEIRRKKRRLFFLNAASDKEEYTGFTNVFPMKDTEKAIREVGAMISDIQKLGDYGIEKWKEDSTIVQ